MSSPFYLVLKGKFVIVGKQPDGDSVRFIADEPDLFSELQRNYRLKPARDRSVQLRFEGIDAPEVHYGRDGQPLGETARDQLLSWMGFGKIKFSGNQVKSADPDAIAGTILTKAADANGRPIAYVLLEKASKQLKNGEWQRIDAELLEQTLNFRLLTSGAAYYTVYTSTPAAHRQQLRTAAQIAQNENLGIWAEDTTAEFALTDTEAITAPNGQLILPKLFRRSIDYLKARADGFRGNLKDWLISVSQRASRSENDLVVIDDSIEVPLSDLVQQRNSRVSFQADLLDITFVEK